MDWKEAYSRSSKPNQIAQNTLDVFFEVCDLNMARAAHLMYSSEYVI